MVWDGSASNEPDGDYSRERAHAVVELVAGALQNGGDVRNNMKTARHAFEECSAGFKSNWEEFRAVANEGFVKVNEGEDPQNAFNDIVTLD